MSLVQKAFFLRQAHISTVIVCGTKFLFGIACFSPSDILCVAEAWLYWNGRTTYSYSSVWQCYTKTKLSSVVHTLYATAITRWFNVAICIQVWRGRVVGHKSAVKPSSTYILLGCTCTFSQALKIPCPSYMP